MTLGFKRGRGNFAALMRILIPTLSSLILLTASACVREVRPPPAQDLTLAGLTAPARDWSGVKVCNVPAATRAEDLTAAAELLERWLEVVTLNPEQWTSVHQQALEGGQRELPAYLDSLKALRDGQATCPGDEALRDVTARVARLEVETRTRLDNATRVVDDLRMAAEVADWTAAQEKAEEEARGAWCPTGDDLPSSPEVYYAREDSKAVESWYFCDGTRVVRYPGEDAVVKAPEETQRRRRPRDIVYLRAIGNFPSSEVKRAPNREAARSEE
jgi:hypothetical protein